MYRLPQALLVLACAPALYAQASAGLETDWDIAAVIQKIADHAAQLAPALDRIDARAWIDRGASETYAEQVQTSRDQAQALADGAKALAKNPERLSACLELFFRMQSLENMLASVQEGVRKYEGAKDAQALAKLQAEGGPNRDRFQRYIVNLAAEREQELQVMDKEAQRCRDLVTALPAKPVKKK